MTSAATQLNPEMAERARVSLAQFVHRFGQAHGLLAAYAAMPIVLTPELLAYLRTTFLQGEVPWVAEADLLLSDLCAPIGYEQFAMDPAVRALLLVDLRERLGAARLEAVARLLVGYVRHQARTDALLRDADLQLQHLSALVYLADQRPRVVEELAGLMEATMQGPPGADERASFERIRRFVQDHTRELAASPELLASAELFGRILERPHYKPSAPQRASAPPETPARAINTRVPDAADPLAQGLAALREVLPSSLEVRHSADLLVAQFHAAQAELGELRALKALHDLFHGLQYKELGSLTHESSRFPDDAMAYENIGFATTECENVLGQIDTLIAQGTISPTDARRDRLASAVAALRAGFDKRDRPTVERALRSLRSIIGTQLSSLNTQIHTRSDIPELGKAITLLSDFSIQLEVFGVDPALRRTLRLIWEALEAQRAAVATLAQTHNAWQEVETELRRIEVGLSVDRTDLEDSWPDLRLRLLALPQSDERADLELREIVERLDAALQSGDPRAMPFAFDRLQNRVRRSFFTVDAELLRLVEQLRASSGLLDNLRADLA